MVRQKRNGLPRAVVSRQSWPQSSTHVPGIAQPSLSVRTYHKPCDNHRCKRGNSAMATNWCLLVRAGPWRTLVGMCVPRSSVGREWMPGVRGAARRFPYSAWATSRVISLLCSAHVSPTANPACPSWQGNLASWTAYRTRSLLCYTGSCSCPATPCRV